MKIKRKFKSHYDIMIPIEKISSKNIYVDAHDNYRSNVI